MNDWLRAGLSVTAIVGVAFAFLFGLDWLIGREPIADRSAQQENMAYWSALCGTGSEAGMVASRTEPGKWAVVCLKSRYAESLLAGTGNTFYLPQTKAAP